MLYFLNLVFVLSFSIQLLELEFCKKILFLLHVILISYIRLHVSKINLDFLELLSLRLFFFNVKKI